MKRFIYTVFLLLACCTGAFSGGLAVRYVADFDDGDVVWTNTVRDYSVPRITVTFPEEAVANTSTFYHVFSVGTSTYTNVVDVVGDSSLQSYHALEDVISINFRKGDSLRVSNSNTNSAFLHVDADRMD